MTKYCILKYFNVLLPMNEVTKNTRWMNLTCALNKPCKSPKINCAHLIAAATMITTFDNRFDGKFTVYFWSETKLRAKTRRVIAKFQKWQLSRCGSKLYSRLNQSVQHHDTQYHWWVDKKWIQVKMTCHCLCLNGKNMKSDSGGWHFLRKGQGGGGRCPKLGWG